MAEEEEIKCCLCNSVPVGNVYIRNGVTISRPYERWCGNRREWRLTYCQCGPMHASCLTFHRGLYPETGWEDSRLPTSTVWQCQTCHTPYKFAKMGRRTHFAIFCCVIQDLTFILSAAFILIGFFTWFLLKLLSLDHAVAIRVHEFLFGLYFLSLFVRASNGIEYSTAYRNAVVQNYLPIPLEMTRNAETKL